MILSPSSASSSSVLASPEDARTIRTFAGDAGGRVHGGASRLYLQLPVLAAVASAVVVAWVAGPPAQ